VAPHGMCFVGQTNSSEYPVDQSPFWILDLSFMLVLKTVWSLRGRLVWGWGASGAVDFPGHDHCSRWYAAPSLSGMTARSRPHLTIYGFRTAGGPVGRFQWKGVRAVSVIRKESLEFCARMRCVVSGARKKEPATCAASEIFHNHSRARACRHSRLLNRNDESSRYGSGPEGWWPPGTVAISAA